MNDNEKFYTVRGYQLLEQSKKPLTSAMEDYLEMIYRNSLEEGYIRINTLSSLLNVHPSSTTKMVQKLCKSGFIDYEKYGIIKLTDEGKEIGKFLLKRHEIIQVFLENLGGSSVLLETELIEHNVTIETLKNLDALNLFFKENPDIIGKFKQFKIDKSNKKNCAK